VALRALVWVAVLLTALLLQTVVFAGLTVFGWRPDLVVVTVVAFALAEGPDTGLRYGFVAGLAVDLLAGAGLVGVSALVYLLVGYLCGLLRPYVANTVLAGQVAVTAVAGAAAVLGYGLVALLLDFAHVNPLSVLAGALVVGLYDAAVAPFVCRPVAALSARFRDPAAQPGG
jgi:rod shape-determining protein MreD